MEEWLWLLLLLPALVVVWQLALAIFLLVTHARYRMYCRHKGVEAPIQGAELLAYLYREHRAISTLQWWRWTRSFTDGVRFGASPHRDARPVVLTHGFTQNGSNMWGYRVALEARGRPTTAASLGLPLRKIPAYCPPLSIAIRQALMVHGEELGVDVVCHSMGGLVLRQLLVDEPDLRPHIRNVVTVGSPHQGTAAARGFVPFPDAGQMRRHSSYLRALPTLGELVPHATHHCVAAEMDYVVYPLESSLEEGARHVVLREPGHGGMLTSRKAIAAVVECVDGEPSRIADERAQAMPI